MKIDISLRHKEIQILKKKLQNTLKNQKDINYKSSSNGRRRKKDFNPNLIRRFTYLNKYDLNILNKIV